MRKDEQRKLFKRFQSGDGPAFQDLLEALRPTLFDYLLRMTSQVSRSVDSINEVYESLSEDSLETMTELADLRLLLYATARRFNSDIWNAETSRLTNAALSVASTTRAHQLLDKELRSLPGPEREVLYLHLLSEFSLEAVAHIVALDGHSVETLYLRAVGTVDAAAEDTCGPAQKALPTLPLHPLPPPSSNATVNLSMVMAGIKAKPAGLWSVRRLVGPLLLVAALLIWWSTPPAVWKNLLATYLPAFVK